MKKKPILRIKIMSIVSGTFIVYQLPVTVQLDSVRFDLDEDGALVLMDDGVLRWMWGNRCINMNRRSNQFSSIRRPAYLSHSLSPGFSLLWPARYDERKT